MLVDKYLMELWKKHGSSIVQQHSPNSALQALCEHKNAAHLIVRRPVDRESTYEPDLVSAHRSTIISRMLISGLPYIPASYVAFNNEVYPYDLSTISGPWLSPLPFLFKNLMVLDIALDDAIYWMFGILNATCESTSLRRIILRNPDDLRYLPFQFPFMELDHILTDRPAIKVILLFGNQPTVQEICSNLPLLVLRNGLANMAEGKFHVIFHLSE